MCNTKKCMDCQRVLPIDDFFLSSKSKDGYSGTCKECYMYYRKGGSRKNKNMVKRDDAALFIQDLLKKGELFECKSCHESMLADSFYTKRDYGKVYLVRTGVRCVKSFIRLRRNFT